MTGRATGRLKARPTLTPTELITDTPEIAGRWTAQIITLFPQVFPGVLGESVTGKALKDGLWQLRTTDLRSHGIGKHRNVDDTPYGGGAGMVLRPDVLDSAIRDARAGVSPTVPLVYLSPRGARFDQATARHWARNEGVTLICGRFEGVDDRVLTHFGIQEISLGDFVMTGGEIAAQAMIDATVRLLPGVLGNAESAVDESFSDGLLEHPQFTKPAEWRGLTVPDVLMSGNHDQIAKWRHAMSEETTKTRRPDLWDTYQAKHGLDRTRKPD